MSKLRQFLTEICQQTGLQLLWSSKDWVATIIQPATDDAPAARRFVCGYKFDLNSAAASLIASDKNATFEVLTQAHLPVIPHSLLYAADNPAQFARDCQSFSYLQDRFQAYNCDIVIKPNNGTQGNNVFHLTTLEDIQPKLERVFTHSDSASICPFYASDHEYRLIVLDGVVRLAYQKNRGSDWRFNLSKGASASKIANPELYERLQAIALQAAQALDLRFCSVDIIHAADRELAVLEVNSGVTIDHYLEFFPEEYDLVKGIYRDAVLKMFENAECGLGADSALC